MNSRSEQRLLQRLKSNDSSDVQKALTLVRQKYSKNSENMKKLMEHSFAEVLVGLLSHPKHCNAAAGIIADMCVDKTFVFDMVKNNAVKYLVQIVKSNINEDVQTRACRAIANIAQCPFGAKAIHELNPIPAILALLKETENVNCQQTALRALRILGDSPKHREIISCNESFTCVVELICSEEVSVSSSCCQTLCEITELCSVKCADRVLEIEVLNSLQKKYGSSSSRFKGYVIRIIRNIISAKNIDFNLSLLEFLPILEEAASMHESMDARLNAVFCLCACLKYVHLWENRGLDMKDGIGTILSFLQWESFKHIHIDILSSLLTFGYDTSISKTFIQLDLVGILLNLLKTFVDEVRSPLQSDDIIANDGSTWSSTNCDIDNSFLASKDCHSDCIKKSHKGDFSHNSNLSVCLSDKSLHLTNNNMPKKEDQNLTAGSVIENNKSNRNISMSLLNHSRNTRKRIDYLILKLLKSVCNLFVKQTAIVIIKNLYFNILVDYVKFSPYFSPIAVAILLIVAKCHDTFESVVTYGFVMEISKVEGISVAGVPLPSTDKITSLPFQKVFVCLQEVAKTDYFVNVLKKILITSDVSAQVFAIHAVSKLVFKANVLYGFFFHTSWKSVIWQRLEDTSESKFPIIFESVCEIFRRVECERKDSSKKLCLRPCCYDKAIKDVVFLVEGKKLLASREVLCQNSEYFRALLDGHFLEKKREVIEINGSSAVGLDFIFHYLHGCVEDRQACRCVKNASADDLVESLTECEKFLLPDIKSFVVGRLEDCTHLGADTVTGLYTTSKMLNCISLSRKALCFLFRESYLKSYKDIFDIDKGLIKDIESFFLSIFLPTYSYGK